MPNNNDTTPSHSHAKKFLTSMDMGYHKIHACPNDYILFHNEYEHLLECPMCGSKKFREDVMGEGIPTKVLRHFPIIQRIKNMFRCKDIAKLMTRHQTTRSQLDSTKIWTRDRDTFALQKHWEWVVLRADPKAPW